MTMAAATAGDAVVRLHGLVKRYASVVAVDRVDLDVLPGRMHGLIGPDGAGKSSLMKIVAGVLTHDAGTVQVFGQTVDSERSAERVKQRIGLMPQGLGQNLYAELSIEENIDFFARLRGVDGEVLASRKHQLLEMTRLERFRTRPMKQLSGGMKQKLGLVCTLIHEPRADHPRRADHRRRPGVASRLLGDPRRAGQCTRPDRPGIHRLHG